MTDAPDQPTEAPRAAERIAAIRTLMQEWSTDRFVSAGHTPAARSLVADAGLELLAEIDRLTIERDDARAALQEAAEREAALKELLAQAAVFWRPVVADVEHGILSAESIRFMVQDFVAGLQEHLAAPDRSDREGTKSE